jgi:hypothetical protein
VADTKASTTRAKAWRRLAAQPRHGASRPLVARRTEASGNSVVRTGFTLELLLSTIVAAAIAMTIVAVSGSEVGPGDIPTLERHSTIIPKLRPEEAEDLDPRDPLVLCTVYETHTHCVREET